MIGNIHMAIRPLTPALMLLLALVAPAQGHDWCSYLVPPPDQREEPTVKYLVHLAPPADLSWLCSSFGGHPVGMAGGCARNQGADQNGNEHWVIFVRADLSPEHTACVLLHEKAHLPPNNWSHGPACALRILPGNKAPAPGPKWRRLDHVDPFFFVRGRGGVGVPRTDP
jgi:hypothetical protein